MQRRFRTWSAVLLGLALLASCLPITLSVGPDGRVAVARAEGIFVVDLKTGAAECVYRCGSDVTGAWAVWSRDGKQLLYATKGPGDNYQVTVQGLGGGEKPVKVLSTGNQLGFASFSPSGKHVAVVVAPGFGKPTITVHDAATGKQVGTLESVSTFHAWRADGEALYILHIGQQDKAGIYQATVVEMDTAGKTKPLFRVATKQDFCLDYSAKANLLGVVALGTAADPKKDAEPVDKSAPKGPGATARPAEQKTYLFFYDLKGGDAALRQVPVLHPRYVAFSPSGEQALTNSGERKDSLLVLDTKTLATARTLAKEIPVRTESLGDNATILPVWTQDGQAVIFWRYLPTMGLHGKSLRTRRVELASGKETDLEHVLDAAVYKALASAPPAGDGKGPAKEDKKEEK